MVRRNVFLGLVDRCNEHDSRQARIHCIESEMMRVETPKLVLMSSKERKGQRTRRQIQIRLHRCKKTSHDQWDENERVKSVILAFEANITHLRRGPHLGEPMEDQDHDDLLDVDQDCDCLHMIRNILSIVTDLSTRCNMCHDINIHMLSQFLKMFVNSQRPVLLKHG